MQIVLEIIGWVGSGLVVLSLMQARVLRFRWMNMIGSLIATVYNAVIEVWPFAAMNAAIFFIGVYWIRRLYREANDPHVYQVVPLDPEDRYLQHLLDVHADDIAHFAPGFTAHSVDDARITFLIVRGDEAVGVVAARREEDGTADIELDWVKPRFRDFGPGKFVYSESDALPAAGIRRARVAPHATTDTEYLRKAGFHKEGGAWIRDLSAAA